MRWLVLIAAAVALFLTGCTGERSGGLGPVEVEERSNSAIADSRAVVLDSVVTDSDRAVVVFFVGGKPRDTGSDSCATDYSLSVEESESSVHLLVTELKADPPLDMSGDFTCTGVGYRRRLETTLEQAIGARQVIDVSIEQEFSHVLHLGRLPIFAPSEGRFNLVELASFVADGAYNVQFGEDANGEVQLTLSVRAAQESEPRLLRAGEGQRISDTEVRGLPAKAVESVETTDVQLRWTEAGHFVELSTVEPLSLNDLVEIALYLEWP